MNTLYNGKKRIHKERLWGIFAPKIREGFVMANMPKEVMDMFNNPNASKVLATLDTSQKIHAVPHGSIMAIAPDKIAFAKGVKGKTWENLETTKIASITAFITAGKIEESIGY
jgi:hypothetical protein